MSPPAPSPVPLACLIPLTCLLPCMLATGGLSAQIAVRPPARIVGAGQDPGARVEMFESPNLDRFLRKAQTFLGKDDYSGAIRVLQDVIEGRTGEFMAMEDDEPDKVPPSANPGAKPGTRPEPARAQPKVQKTESPIDEEDPAYSVFSSDERIYRPVSRLCHELLASMPAEGVGLYRVKYEAEASTQLDAARAAGDLPALEAVYNSFFVTLAAAHAMETAADLLMDAGRFRAAIQTLNHLLEIYPQDSRREAGLRDLELMVKVAVCYQQLGETALAMEQLAAVTRLFPEASVRVMGELHTVKDMQASPLFAADAVAVERPRHAAVALDMTSTKALAPLWEFRFTDEEPYRSTKSRVANPRQRIQRMAGQPASHGTKFPKHTDKIPGTTVRFEPGRLVFLDNYRPVVHDLISGRQVMAMGAAELAVPKSPTNNNAPRARTPSYDIFANRVARDATRYFFVEGSTKTSPANSFKAIQLNRLVAYDRVTGAELWGLDGQGNRKRPITYLATPTVHRQNLLVPILDMGSYALMGLQATDGKELFRTYLHSGGTDFARAPTPQVVVNSGIAYVLTNAGVVSAVDATTGVLHWSRRYERVDPYHGTPAKASKRHNYNAGFRTYAVAQAGTFRGFAPSDLYLVGDLLIVAAVDSTALLCLNAASGEILWVHNGEATTNQSVLNGKLSYIVGNNDEFLFVLCGDTQLICVGLRSGLRYWVAAVPGMDNGWRGRGFVTPEYVVMPGRPGARQVHVVPANTKKQPRFRTLDLPGFSIGKEPLVGPSNLQVDDAYLAVCYEGGVELYSSVAALSTLAAKSSTIGSRATFLVHAGKLEAAIDILIGQLATGELDVRQRRRTALRVLTLAEEIASLLATNGRREAALAILDRCEKHMQEPRLMLRVHLFRLQVYRTLGDIAGVEREQEFIENGGVN